MNVNKIPFYNRMIALAEMYYQNPEDPYFDGFSDAAMHGIKLLSRSVQKAKKDGKIHHHECTKKACHVDCKVAMIGEKELPEIKEE